MVKNCIDCGKVIPGGWGNRKRCGSIAKKIGCSYKHYLNKEKTIRDKISFSDKNYKWRMNNIYREDYHCQDCKIKGRQRTVLDFPDLPVLYVDRPINDIIKRNNITTLEEAEACEELWKDGIVLCVDCYDKKHKTHFRKTEKTLLKKLLNAHPAE